MPKAHRKGKASAYERRSMALHRVADLAALRKGSQRQAAQQAAKEFPEYTASALRSALIRHHGVIERTNVHQLFADDQESVLLGVIRAFSLANRPLSRMRIIMLARRHFSLPASWRGRRWYESFVRRHKASIRPRYPHELAPKRTRAELLSLVKE